MNNFIVSGKGFLKSTDFNVDTKQVDVVWTDLLRDAQKFNTKTAVAIIEKNKLEAFVWNPYKEEPIRGKWEVVQRQKHYDFFNDEDHKALEWKAVRVTMEKKTDVNFLLTKGVEKKGYYNSEEEAIEIAQERNQAIIAELECKMQKLNQKINN